MTRDQDRRDANSMLNWEQGRAQHEPRAIRNQKRAWWGVDLARLRERDELAAMFARVWRELRA